MSNKSKKELTEHVLRRFWLPIFILVLIITLIMWDIVVDMALGTSVIHIVLEVLMMLALATAAFYFWNRFRVVWRARKNLGQDLKKAQEEAIRWEEREQQLLSSLREAINNQFMQWGFSPADKEIAYFLLKGLSLKEIAHLRGSSSNSIKQQCHMLYNKAGLKGRAELSAFFLGKLLQTGVETDEINDSRLNMIQD